MPYSVAGVAHANSYGLSTLAEELGRTLNIPKGIHKPTTTSSVTTQLNELSVNKSKYEIPQRLADNKKNISSHSRANHLDGMRTGFGGTGMEVDGTGMEVDGMRTGPVEPRLELDQYERPIIRPSNGRGGKKRKSKRMNSRSLRNTKENAVTRRVGIENNDYFRCII